MARGEGGRGRAGGRGRGRGRRGAVGGGPVYGSQAPDFRASVYGGSLLTRNETHNSRRAYHNVRLALNPLLKL